MRQSTSLQAPGHLGLVPRASRDLASLLEAPQRLELLCRGLEAAVPQLGGRVNKLELDVLQGGTAGVCVQRLPQCDQPLLGAWHCTLQSGQEECCELGLATDDHNKKKIMQRCALRNHL